MVLQYLLNKAMHVDCYQCPCPSLQTNVEASLHLWMSPELSMQIQVKKVGRDSTYFPSSAWRVSRISTDLWRTFQTQIWGPLPSQNSSVAAQGSQDKDYVTRLLGPAHSNSHAPCSFGTKCLLLLLFSLLAAFQTLRYLFCPVTEPPHMLFPLPLPLLCPDKSYGFQPSIFMAK